MNPKPGPPKANRMTLDEAEALARRDKRRLLLLSLATVLLIAAYLATRSTEQSYERDANSALPDKGQPQLPSTPQVVTLPFDDTESLAGIRDGDSEERVTLSNKALSSLLYYAKLLTWQNYEALGIQDLTPELIQTLSDNPGEHRVDPLRARGRVIVSASRKRADTGFEESYGTLALDTGGHTHFVFTTPVGDDFGSGLQAGQHIVFSGLFAQMLRTETPKGWIEAPLVACRHIDLSMPPTELLSSDALRSALIANVADDEMENITGLPQEPYDQLLLYAAKKGAEEDWDNALELNAERLNGIMRGGDAFRGVPFKIPVSRNLGTWAEHAEENGLRLDTMTHGWIGNFNWTGATGLIKWVGPFTQEELDQRNGEARLLTAQGYFFKHLYYLRKDMSPHRAPLFVMSSVTPFIPQHDPTASQILYGVLGMTMGIVGLIIFLLRKDRIASERLRNEVVRRRRARREKQTPVAETP